MELLTYLEQFSNNTKIDTNKIGHYVIRLGSQTGGIFGVFDFPSQIIKSFYNNKIYIARGEYFISFENPLMYSYDEYLKNNYFVLLEPDNFSFYDHPSLLSRDFSWLLEAIFNPLYNLVQPTHYFKDEVSSFCKKFYYNTPSLSGEYVYSENLSFDLKIMEGTQDFRLTVKVKNSQLLSVQQVFIVLKLVEKLSVFWFPHIVEVIHV